MSEAIELCIGAGYLLYVMRECGDVSLVTKASTDVFSYSVPKKLIHTKLCLIQIGSYGQFDF